MANKDLYYTLIRSSPYFYMYMYMFIQCLLLNKVAHTEKQFLGNVA